MWHSQKKQVYVTAAEDAEDTHPSSSRPEVARSGSAAANMSEDERPQSEDCRLPDKDTLPADSVCSEYPVHAHGKPLFGSTKKKGLVPAAGTLVQGPPSNANDLTNEAKTQHETHRRMRVDLFDDVDDHHRKGFMRAVRNTYDSLHRVPFFIELTKKDFHARRGNYILSFSAVFFVVLLCVAMISILSNLPAVFLRLAEPSVGQADLVLRPGGQLASASSLNYTAMTQLLVPLSKNMQLHTPRVEFSAYAFRPQVCRTASAASLWFPYNSSTTSAAARATLRQQQVDDVFALTQVNRSAAVVEDAVAGPAPAMAATHSTAPSVYRTMCVSTCFTEWCQQDYGPTVTLIALNFTRENELGIGPYSDFPYKAPAKGEAIISTDVASELRVGVGGNILFVATDVGGALGEFYSRIPEAQRNYHLSFQLRVRTIVQPYSYKFPSTSDFVLVNYEHLGEMIASGMAPSLTSSERQSVAATPTNSAATLVYFRLPRAERRNAYLQSDYKAVRRQLLEWGSHLVNVIGANQLSPTTPILNYLNSLQYFSMFVGLIMSIILLALAFLSIMLIYSLLTVGVETRTLEMGIQRMVGFTREDLAVMVLTNAYCFAIPGWLLGLVAGQIVYIILRAIILGLVAVDISLSVSGASLGYGTLAGLLIPLAAAVLPVLSLLTLQLPDALDSARSRGSGVVYKIKRAGQRHLNGTVLGLGVFFAVFGFLLYYLFPSSLINSNLSLMFYIFFFVLLGMLAGLTLLATNFERVMETFVLYTLFFWETRAVFRMIQKSLAAHRLRNRKTTLMYALSLAFIIFVTVALRIEMSTLEYDSYRARGGEVTVTFPVRARPLQTVASSKNKYLTVRTDGGSSWMGSHGWLESDWLSDSDEVEAAARRQATDTEWYDLTYERNFYLQDYAQLRAHLSDLFDNGTIASVTYRCANTLDYAWPLQSLYVQTPGRYVSSFSGIVPVPPSFYDVVFSNFVRVRTYGTNVARYGLSGALYSSDGTREMVIATTTYKKFAFRSLNDTAVARSVVLHNATASSALGSTASSTTKRVTAFRPSSVMDSSAIVLMTQFPNKMGEILTSLPSIAFYSGIDYFSVRSVPVIAIIFRVPEKKYYDVVKSRARNYLTYRGFYPGVSDIETGVKDIKLASRIFTAFLIFSVFMILTVCFFSLMSSMTTNILQSSKEIGILLCVGMTHFQLYRLYVFEAFVLLLASGVLGMIVGTIVAYTMLLQNTLFSQLPMPFAFPYLYLCIVAVVGVVSALASSVGPVTYLLRMPSITHILRRVVS